VVKGDPATHIADIENVEIVFKDGVGYETRKLLDSVKGHMESTDPGWVERRTGTTLRDRSSGIRMALSQEASMAGREERFLVAAVAGITMGLLCPAKGGAVEKKGDVKCWGVNGCGAHATGAVKAAKCSVTADDLKAFEALLGEKEYKERFGKSEMHSCGSHAQCGASAKILNWLPTSREECRAQGGYLVEEVGTPPKKVARKA
jgi:hypothetical protein